MPAYDTTVGEHTITINYLRGGTNQVGIKKSLKVKAWATCPLSGKRIEGASDSLGEATRTVEKGLIESIAAAQAAENTPEPAAA
jgi:hypothetical protein